MTRDQALAILNDLPLIRHFANGGEIAVNIRGTRFKTNSILISNFRSDRQANYEIIKPRYRIMGIGKVVTND